MFTYTRTLRLKRYTGVLLFLRQMFHLVSSRYQQGMSKTLFQSGILSVFVH